jgi:small subunit ribosomal protein S4
MTENNAQCRLCRRMGKKLFLKGDRCETAKCAMVKRNYPPGAHGQKNVGARLSDYGRQLKEKQSARIHYNLTEKQFRNYFEKAISRKEETGQGLYSLLEMRLDNVVYRLGWGKSIKHARQLVNHGHFTVNGKKVDIPSYNVKVNDVIAVREISKKSKNFEELSELMKKKDLPHWLFFDAKDNIGKVVDYPNLKKAVLGFDIQSIIEFYSR